MYDLVIKNGTIVDGTGEARFSGDIAVKDGVIAEVGKVSGTAYREVNADGLLVTPGFVDIHSHYDGQVTWDSHLSPSSSHGVTTTVMGNCGVGFAPCKPEDRERMISLMEGVEDIPHPVLTEGLPWNWESFAEYLEALEARPHDIDFGCQLPHGALRVYVMGERGALREAATADDIAEMSKIAEQAIKSGALGFSTSRTLNHRTSDGDPTPSYLAAAQELIGISHGLKRANAGVLQFISDFTDFEQEAKLVHDMTRLSGRPLIFSLGQTFGAPESWRDILRWVEGENANGQNITAMVCGRPVGVLLGLDATMNPFSLNPVYQKIEKKDLAERVSLLNDQDLRRAILEAENGAPENPFRAVTSNYDYMFELGDIPDYEQAPDQTIAARASQLGISPQELAYDLMLKNEGRKLLYTAFINYAQHSLEPSLAMMRHPNTVLGLADGGAHVGMICDGSFPTSMLTHWTRDRTRGERLSLEWVVQAQTRKTALAYGMADRGLLKAGFKADINLIDYENLTLHHPYMVRDLPAGGRRLMQKADGYVQTIVSGVTVQEQGVATEALPGKLIRGPQAGPRVLLN